MENLVLTDDSGLYSLKISDPVMFPVDYCQGVLNIGNKKQKTSIIV